MVYTVPIITHASRINGLWKSLAEPKGDRCYAPVPPSKTCITQPGCSLGAASLFLMAILFSLVVSAHAQSGYPGGGYPGGGGSGGYPGGGYPGSGGWVASDAGGNPLTQYGRALNTDGSVNLLPSGNQPTKTNTYPIPAGAADWWFAAYSPNDALTGDPGNYYYNSLNLSSSAANTVRDNYGQGPIGFYDPTNHGGDRSDATPLPPNLLGSVHADNSDTLTAYFVWTGDPAHVPDHQDFLICTSVSASASVNYGSAGATSGVKAKAVATLGSDAVTALAGDYGSQSPPSLTRNVLVRAVPTGKIITLSRAGSVSVDTTDGLLYATWVPGDHDFYYYGPGNGYTSASAGANAAAKANTDSRGRELYISSDIETSYFKGAVDAQHPVGKWQHIRNADGSMTVDAGVVPNTGVAGGGGYHADVTYTANTLNFLNSGEFFWGLYLVAPWWIGW